MKSQAVYLESADLQKCSLLERKFSNSKSVFVKLQRPPPDIRIFFPTLFDLSMTNTLFFLEAAVIAAMRPAAPAPRTTTSYFIKFCIGEQKD